MNRVGNISMLIGSALAGWVFSIAAHGAPACRDIDWDRIPAAAVAGIPFRPVDPRIIAHDRETRGFISAPLDYAAPDGREIEIFYRLIPSASGASAPILLIMNGGPGVSSSGYRALDHDYDDAAETDALSELARYFRLVLVDQRGTGASAPLDLDDPSLSPEVIAAFFASDSHARDHARVIDAVVPEGEPFFILARSYGGHIGFQYLALGGTARQPAGFVFSSALTPRPDALGTFLARREKQRELNISLRRSHPRVVDKLDRLRAHFASVGVDPNAVNYLWEYLGRGESWKEDLDASVDRYLGLQSRPDIETELGGGVQKSISLLNYVLSSAALTPGYTDRTLTTETSRRIPFESWMLDENWTLAQLGGDGGWRDDFLCSVDRRPPPATVFDADADIRRALAGVRALFTFGASDALLPQDYQLRNAQRYDVPGRTDFEVFSGGHGAAFSQEGAVVVWNWAARILEGDGAAQ